MLRAEEFTSRHAVTLGDKKCILSPFARILDPSLPFYLFPPSSLLSLSRLFSLLLPQEQRIMLFRFAYTFHRLLLYIPDTISPTDFSPRFANRILRSFPFISLSRPVCSINRELQKKIILRIESTMIKSNLRTTRPPYYFPWNSAAVAKRA